MYSRILVPLDGSELAESVLTHVRELTTGCGIKEIILMRICEPQSIPADYPASMPAPWEEHVKNMRASYQQQCGLYLEEAKKRLADTAAIVRVETDLGPAAEKIAEYASSHDVDLIVMASHGRSGPGRWAFGSVADKVLRSSCVPVMMIKAPGCVPGI